MKFVYEQRDIESSAPIEERRVSIKANAKTFKLLFKNIYPDIIKASVREIITNAWDSQKMRGNLDTPIEIHSPGEFEPFFAVRDYGVSMSHKFVMNEFTFIGESTKDETDEFAGMFGMGRMSPLGYTDTFSLQCWLDGKTRIYDIYLSSDGSPNIKFVYEDVSDEPDGALITLGVRTEDKDAFKAAIKRMLVGFPSPIILDGDLIEKDIVDYSGDGWMLIDNPAIKTAHVRMGCVMYPIRASYLGYGFNYSDALDFQLIFDFPIGTFDVAGSREDIIYTTEVTKQINDAYAIASKEFGSQFLEEIVSQESPLFAYSKLNEINRKWKGLVKWLKADKVLYRGRSLQQMMFGDMVKYDALKYRPFTVTFEHYDITHNGRSPKVKPFPPYTGIPKFTRQTEYKYVLVTTVELKNLNRRIKSFILEKKANSQRVESSEILLIYTNESFNSFTLKRFAAILGQPEFIDLTKVQAWKPDRLKNPKPIRQQHELWLNSFSVIGNTMSRKAPRLVDQTKEVLFTLTESNQPIKFGAGEFHRYFTEVKSPTFELYQIPRFQYSGFLRKYPQVKFVNITDKIEELVKRLQVSDSEIDSAAAAVSFTGLQLNPKIHNFLVKFSGATPQKLTGFKETLMNSNPQLNQKYHDSLDKFERTIPAFFEKYPLLSFVTRFDEVDEKVIDQYMKLIP